MRFMAPGEAQTKQGVECVGENPINLWVLGKK